MLLAAGARSVRGCDVSKSALAFARSQYPGIRFDRLSVTALDGWADGTFGLTVCSEVLEHVKEYGVEDVAVAELARATDGLVVVTTPNTEMWPDHGFSFDEISSLFGRHFARFEVFENAFVPPRSRRGLWDARVRDGRVGTVISENIRLDEAVLPEADPLVKEGEPAGVRMFAGWRVDTRLLHNTHSWVVLATNRVPTL
jgi:hypothetical protein